jgi:hypothetical protein
MSSRKADRAICKKQEYFTDFDCDPEEGIMRRRDFLKKGKVAVGLASSPKLLAPLMAGESNPQNSSRIYGPSVDYLRRVQRDEFLPKPPAFWREAPAGHGQLQPALAGGKAGANTFEAWSSQAS